MFSKTALANTFHQNWRRTIFNAILNNDYWKENFLLRLKDEGKIEVIFENREYRISGMPFYNYDVPEKLNIFKKSFEELV